MRELVRKALAALGIRRLLLSVHDASLPGDPADDVGHGAPLSNGGRAFLRFAARLGFDGLQLGPQGETTPYNPSPYDATLFSRNLSSLSLARLVDDGVVPGAALAEAVANRPQGALARAAHQYAHDTLAHALKAAAKRDVRDFANANASWIARYGLNGDEVFAQFLAHDQHRRFRDEAHALGLVLVGDLQIGISPRDARAFAELLVPGLFLGAPPSRTNPEGQAWGYGVLDPEQGDAALAFVCARAKKLFGEFDGLRVDHPHGLIDPWVYRGDVRDGARLYSSPDVFPRWAIARLQQIDVTQARYADGWVRDLDGAQVDRYARIFDALVSEAGAADRLIVEILSTQPYPVRRVLERHGLGQFRVTQKADPRDVCDVYRSANARPQDWITAGTHDTEPIWRVAERWGPAHAEYLASRLRIDPSSLRDAPSLARAQLADLFVGPAQNVLVFFADLLGMREIYNRPGTISPENWTLRVPPDFEERYARGAGLHLPSALAMALRARGTEHAALVDALSAIR